MRRAVLACAVVYGFVLSFLSYAQTTKPVETIPLSQIHAGMHGVAYTVFQGTKPEPMDVEVLGVLKNANGPKGDIILVRLGGAKAEYTGVVAGMSGSPVYLKGKLAGAVAFRIGEFSKEPIAGVTPISEMLEISALDNTPASVPIQAKSIPSIAAKTSGPGLSSAPAQNFANYLKPIETPLVFSGAVKISPPGRFPHLSRLMMPLVFNHLSLGESSASNSVPCGVLQVIRLTWRARSTRR